MNRVDFAARAAACPTAYRGPYPILSHRTLADVGPAVIIEGEYREVHGQRFRSAHQPVNRVDLRIDQDEADAAFARQQVRLYRIAPRQPARPDPAMPRIWALILLAASLIGGALLVGLVFCVMAALGLAFGQ